MIIRESQIKIFEDKAIESYVIELTEHCREFAPHLCKPLSDAQLKNAVEQGIKDAETFGLNQRGPVRFFVDMMMFFGSKFYTDPQYKWATEILSEANEENQLECSEKLYEQSQNYLEKTNGTENEFLFEAFEKISELRSTKFKPENFDQAALDELEKIFPQKVAATDQESLQEIILKGKKKAIKKYGFRSRRSVGLVILLMFVFGHEFDSDPFLPWIRKSLEEKNETDADKVAKDLERRMLVWLDAAIKNAKEVS